MTLGEQIQLSFAQEIVENKIPHIFKAALEENQKNEVQKVLESLEKQRIDLKLFKKQLSLLFVRHQSIFNQNLMDYELSKFLSESPIGPSLEENLSIERILEAFDKAEVKTNHITQIFQLFI